MARISDLLAEAGTVVWLDLLQPSEADLSVLIDELGLHPLAVEDALHGRPKRSPATSARTCPTPAGGTCPGSSGSTVLLVGAVGGLFQFCKRKGWL